MDRRKSIKTLVVGSVAAGVLINACDTPDKQVAVPDASNTPSGANADRMVEEITHNKQLNDEKFFTAHEMATLGILADIIIPADEVSGSATDAKVPDFIEFMVKDRPENKIPMRGGLRWLDVECLNQYEKSFKDCSSQQQIELVDKIAYPKKVQPGYEQGVAFFTLMRNLTLSGFYSSEIGTKDVGYMGNTPNQWNGVPEDVLKQYNLSYSEKELRESVSFDKA